MFLVETASNKYKTGVRERKQRFLFLGIGLHDRPWAIEWIRVRECDRIGMNLAMPAWSQITQEWTQRPLTTGEATLYLVPSVTLFG